MVGHMCMAYAHGVHMYMVHGHGMQTGTRKSKDEFKCCESNKCHFFITKSMSARRDSWKYARSQEIWSGFVLASPIRVHARVLLWDWFAVDLDLHPLH